MLINDLEKAVETIKNKLKYCCVTRISLCLDGILFETDMNTNIKYICKTGEIVEYDRDSWRKG